jgi:hypothetical protein
MKYLILAFMLFCNLNLFANEKLFNLPIEGRADNYAPTLQNAHSNGAVNLILIPGGNAGTGAVSNGVPSSRNFLVRSRNYFTSQGFNTFVIFRSKSTDANIMATTYRNTDEHANELKSLINHIGTLNKNPIWIIGTSMGTISTTTAALKISNPQIKGLVLTASVTNKAPGNLSDQALDGIKLPVLMIHHESDACFACVPMEAMRLFDKFTNAPRKEFYMVKGGGPVSGDPCQNQHWHGFIGIEEAVTSQIASWIKANSN